MAKPTKVIAGFPSTRRGEFTLLKTDPKRELLAYALDRAVVLRPLLPTDKPTLLYTEHSYPVTSLEFAPSGSYVASGDASGVVRVWACDNPDLILKLESPMLGGPVLDLAWSGDSQRIVAVGEGREAKGKVVMWDSGNSVGDISCHTKKINSVAFKPNRPFRIVTGGEEGNVNIYHGPPFKFAGRMWMHTRFVNVVRYSPDGARVLSASSDMTLAVYDGKDGSEAASKKLHQGSIFGAAWSPDSAHIATASADKTVGIFDATTLDEVAAVSLGTRVEDMQVGCVWMAEGIVSYSLGGTLSIVDPANPSAPPRVQVGHNRPIASGVYAPSVGRYITGSFASISDSAAPRGVMRSWDLGEGVAAPFAGEAEHTSRIVKMVLTAAGSLVSVGLDDAAVWSNVSPPAAYAKVALDACPTDLSAGGDLCLALTANSEVLVLGAAKVDARQKLAFDATCLAVAPSGASVAVGSSDHTLWLYAPAAGGKLTNERALAGHKGPITCAAFSTDSIKLATGSAAKEIIVWEAASGAPLVTGLNGYHTSSVRCLAWSSAGRLASGGVDGSLVLWTQEGTKVGTKVSNAHAGGVNTISWLSADAVVSAGGDCAIKTWQA